MSTLSQKHIHNALLKLPEWKISDDNTSISRTFTFTDFTEAFNFMERVAVSANQLNHHPNWSNSYNTVSITLTTHESGGLSERDFELAHRIDQAI